MRQNFNGNKKRRFFNNNNNNNNNHHHKPRSNHQSVFDSNGPLGKIRGTAAQIHDKYQQLIRDHQSNNDVVLLESLRQFAEHYRRLLNSFAEENPQQARSHPHQRPVQQDEQISPRDESRDEIIETSVERPSFTPEPLENDPFSLDEKSLGLPPLPPAITLDDDVDEDKPRKTRSRLYGGTRRRKNSESESSSSSETSANDIPPPADFNSESI